MSDLRPKGQVITLGGEERHLLFTLNAIDELQEKFNLSLEETIDLLTDKKKANTTLKTILFVLLEDEADREEFEKKESNLKRYTEKEVGWLISMENIGDVMFSVLKAYGLSLPEPDEFENPKAESGQQKK